MGLGPNDAGLTRKHIVAQAKASLKRLHTDYLDFSKSTATTRSRRSTRRCGPSVNSCVAVRYGTSGPAP